MKRYLYCCALIGLATFLQLRRQKNPLPVCLFAAFASQLVTPFLLLHDLWLGIDIAYFARNVHDSLHPTRL